jgi:hypothetical protein
MSPASDPKYFGKSPFSHLQGVTDAVKSVLSGDSQNEEKTLVEPQTEQDKEKELLKESDNG